MPQLPSGRHVGIGADRVQRVINEAEQGNKPWRLLAIESLEQLYPYIDLMELESAEPAEAASFAQSSLHPIVTLKPRPGGSTLSRTAAFTEGWEAADQQALAEFIDSPRIQAVLANELGKVTEAITGLSTSAKIDVSRQAYWWKEGSHPIQQTSEVQNPETLKSIELSGRRGTLSWSWSWELLDLLIDHACLGHRLWELNRIRHITDLVRYLAVRVSGGLDGLNWPDTNIERFGNNGVFTLEELRELMPIADLASLEEISQEQGLHHTARSQLKRVRTTLEQISKSRDPLIRYELEQIYSGWSKFDRAVWQTANNIPLKAPHQYIKLEPVYSPEFIALTTGLIGLPAIGSVATPYMPDFFLLAALSRERLKREQQGSEFNGYTLGTSGWASRDTDTYDTWDYGHRYAIPDLPQWASWMRVSDEGIGDDGGLDLAMVGRDGEQDERRAATVVLLDRPWRPSDASREHIWEARHDKVYLAVTPAGEHLLADVQAVYQQFLKGNPGHG